MVAKNHSLACPSCAWDGKRPGKLAAFFTLFQFLVREHRVLKANGRELEVDLEVEHEDTGGARPLLRCGNCGHEFDVPAGRKVKFL